MMPKGKNNIFTLITILLLIFMNFFSIFDVEAESFGDGIVNNNDIRVNDEIGTDVSQEHYPAITVDSTGVLYVVWEDGRNGDPDIFIAKSTDRINWVGHTRLNDDAIGNGKTQAAPSIAVDSSDKIHVVWHDYRNDNWDIYYANSTDGGSTWSANTRVDGDLGTNSSSNPSIAVDDDGVYVVWEDNRNGYTDIWFAKSIDAGASFTGHVYINDYIAAPLGTEARIHPAIAVSAGSIYVVWENYTEFETHLHFDKSLTSPISFGVDMQVDDGIEFESCNPAIAVGNGNICVVWDNGFGATTIYFDNSTTGAINFGADIKINDGGDGEDPSIVIYSGNIHVSWWESGKILFDASPIAGISFGTDVQVNDDVASAKFPNIAADSGGIYVVWEDYREGNWDIYFSNSTTGAGGTWSSNVNVDGNGITTANQELTSLVLDKSGKLHVVWADDRNGYDDIYYANSTDGGDTWSSSVCVDDASSVHARAPSIAVDDEGNVYVVWYDDRSGNYDVYFAKSTDGGITWTKPNTRVNDVTTYQQQVPSIAVFGNGATANVYVAWTDNRFAATNDMDVYLSNSTDGGNTFNTSICVNDDFTNEYQLSPSVAVDNNGNLYVAWYDRRNLINYDIYFRRSNDGGNSWTANSKRVNDDTTNDQMWPSIAVSNDIVYVAWDDDRDGIFTGDVYFANSTDGGSNFGVNKKINDVTTSGYYSYPKIAANGMNAYAVWQDHRDGNNNIYFSKSIDGGNTWGSPNDRVDDSPPVWHQEYPSVAIDNTYVYVVWQDERRDPRGDIYFSKAVITQAPLQPTELTATIWEENITLNWTASPSPDVDHYDIYVSNNPFVFDFSAPDAQTLDATTLTWNHTNAAIDGKNYYYVVRANDTSYQSENSNKAGKVIISLNYGWNQVSLPLTQKDTKMSEVLKSIDGNYNVVWWYDAEGGTWHSSFNDLTDINHTMGLWLHMKSVDSLTVVGAMPESTDIVLNRGWNLLGYPSFKSRSLSNALNGINWQNAQHYDAFDANDHWKNNHVRKPVFMNDLSYLKAGHGYWIYVHNECIWSVEN